MSNFRGSLRLGAKVAAEGSFHLCNLPIPLEPVQLLNRRVQPMQKSPFLASLIVAATTASATAQSLNGLDVHGWYNIDGNAEYGVIDETTTVGPGAEFRFDGFGSSGYFESADFDGSTLTLTLSMGESTIKSEGTSWWFHLAGDRAFTSFTLLSDNFPRSVHHTLRNDGLRSGLVVFGIDLWHESEAVPPGSTFTATYQVEFSGASHPIPEPSTYALMFAGLAVVARIAGKTRRRAGQSAHVHRLH